MKNKLLIIFAVLALLLFAPGCKKKQAQAVATPVPVATAIPKMEKILYINNGNLYWMNPDGSGIEMLFSDGASKWFPCVSPDGMYVAYWAQKNGSYNLWVGSFTTAKVSQITFDNDTVEGDIQNFTVRNAPVWTPDGQSIIYSRNKDIWKISKDGFNQEVLTVSHNCISPAISKDNKIVYSRISDSKNANLFIKDLTSLDDNPITNFNGKKAVAPSFSPDGKRIVFTLLDGDTMNILSMDADGKNTVPLTVEGTSHSPVYSYDGKKVVFSSYRLNKYRPEIYIMDISNNLVPVKLTDGGGVSPAWLYRPLDKALPTSVPTIAAAANTNAGMENVFAVKDKTAVPPPVTAAVKPATEQKVEEPQQEEEAPAQPEAQTQGAKPAAQATKIPAIKKEATPYPRYDESAPPGEEMIPTATPVPVEKKEAAAEAETNEDLIVKVTKSAARVTFKPNIRFMSASAEIYNGYFEVLDTIAETLKQYKSPIYLIGHTDDEPIATKEYPSNVELSLARANSVKDYLVTKHNIPEGRFVVQGVGEKNPIVDGSTQRARFLNRRTEVIIKIVKKKRPAAQTAPRTTE